MHRISKVDERGEMVQDRGVGSWVPRRSRGIRSQEM